MRKITIFSLLCLLFCVACNNEREALYRFADTERPAASVLQKRVAVTADVHPGDSIFMFARERAVVVRSIYTQTTKIDGLMYLVLKAEYTDEQQLVHPVLFAYPIVKEGVSVNKKYLISHQCHPELCNECCFVYGELGDICGCDCTESSTDFPGICNHSITTSTLIDPVGPAIP